VHTTQTPGQQEEQVSVNIESEPARHSSACETQVNSPQQALRTSTPNNFPSNCLFDEAYTTARPTTEDNIEALNTSPAYSSSDVQAGPSTHSVPSFSSNASSTTHQSYLPYRSQSSFPRDRDQYPLGPLKGLPDKDTEHSYTNLEEACLMRHFTENLSFWVKAP